MFLNQWLWWGMRKVCGLWKLWILWKEMHRKTGQNYTKLEMSITWVSPGMCIFFHHVSVWALFSHHSHIGLNVCFLLKEKAWFKGNSRWSFSVPSTLLILFVPPSFILCWVFPLHKSVVEKLDTHKTLNECTCKCYITQEWF